MKTLNKYFRKVLVIAIVTLSTMTLYGQKNNESESLIVHLDAVSVDGKYASFQKMVSTIVSKTDFDYSSNYLPGLFGRVGNVFWLNALKKHRSENVFVYKTGFKT